MGRHVGLMKGVFMIFDMSVRAQAIPFRRFSGVISIRLCNLLNGFVRVYMAFRMTMCRFCIPSRPVVRHAPGPGRRLAGRCRICWRGIPWLYGTVCAGLRLSFLKSSDFRLFARSGFGTVLHGNGAVRPRLCRRQAAAALRAAAKSSCQSLIRACARHGFKRGPGVLTLVSRPAFRPGPPVRHRSDAEGEQSEPDT